MIVASVAGDDRFENDFDDVIVDGEKNGGKIGVVGLIKRRLTALE